ncbi:MAG: TatD family hydrolase [Capnocytophaga sp.]|nr:TatD family hydrolase [Capnocytophaga sp.]MDO5104824.1 TatD family hydrolase [Capnocytophaga sp.]
MFFDIHSHSGKSFENELVIQNQFPLTAKTTNWFSVGIHPWYLEDWQKQWEVLESLALHPNCVAIGECGLDKNISESIDNQVKIFEKHIVLSEKLQMPLVIHCVKAFSELISVKKKIQPLQTWIVHGFNKNQSVANLLINSGLKLSFGKSLLVNENVQTVFKSIPDGSYFLETDDSAVSIAEIYKKAYELRGDLNISIKIFQKITI